MHDEIKLTDAQQFVLAHIPHGRDNRIARVWLQRRVGKSDRLIRRMISDMREMGVPIMSTSQLDGYWIPTDDEMARDKQMFRDELNSRIEQISRSGEWAREVAENVIADQL